MFRLLLWGFILYFIVRTIQLVSSIRTRRRPDPPMPDFPPQAGKPSKPFTNIQDADFEEIPPDPDPKKQ